MTVPVRTGIEIVAGDPYVHTVHVIDGAGADVDVSARTYAAQVRENPAFDAPLLESFAVDMTDASDGLVVFRLTAAQTRALQQAIAAGGFDVSEAIGAEESITLFACPVTVTGDYTR